MDTLVVDIHTPQGILVATVLGLVALAWTVTYFVVLTRWHRQEDVS